MAGTPLTDSIEALTTYANQITGASDTNLSDAVYTLAQGYGGGGSAEYIILPDNTLTNSSNIDAYFEPLITGWDSELILLFAASKLTENNEFAGCYSEYAATTFTSLQTVWRMYGTTTLSGITRNDWTLKTTTGRRYQVVRLSNPIPS